MDAPNRDASITDFLVPLAPTNKCFSDEQLAIPPLQCL